MLIQGYIGFFYVLNYYIIYTNNQRQRVNKKGFKEHIEQIVLLFTFTIYKTQYIYFFINAHDEAYKESNISYIPSI